MLSFHGVSYRLTGTLKQFAHGSQHLCLVASHAAVKFHIERFSPIRRSLKRTVVGRPGALGQVIRIGAAWCMEDGLNRAMYCNILWTHMLAIFDFVQIHQPDPNTFAHRQNLELVSRRSFSNVQLIYASRRALRSLGPLDDENLL